MLRQTDEHCKVVVPVFHNHTLRSRNSDAIPERMAQFLSLEALDTNQVQIQTFVGNNSAKNLSPLVSYISSQRGHDFSALVAALKDVDQLSDQKEKAIRLVKTLLPYKEALKNKAQQDSIIVFVYYALKKPSELSPEAKGKISSLVRQLDTAAQADKFDSGECPSNYLRGPGFIGISPSYRSYSAVATAPFGFALKELGKFRVISHENLSRFAYDENRARLEQNIRHLKNQQLIADRQMETKDGRHSRVLTLTRETKRFLRHQNLVPKEQALYEGFIKPKELAHDAELYRLYQRIATEIEMNGGKVRRVILDYELKAAALPRSEQSIGE